MVHELSLKSKSGHSRFRLLALIVSTAVAALVYFLLTRVDLIVHAQLYTFGLSFSPVWADPYRLFMWLIYGCLLTPVVLYGAAFLSGLVRLKPKASIGSPVEIVRSSGSVLRNSKFRLLALAVSLVVAGVVYFLLTRVDVIVHEQLYSFGLVFSHEWVDPYRAYMWAIYGCLLSPVALSCLACVFSVVKVRVVSPKKHSTVESPRGIAVLPVKPVEVQVEVKASSIVESSKETLVEVGIEEETLMVAQPSETRIQVDEDEAACPACKKRFHLPLVMLDFEGGKARLVNVCPYCNHVMKDNEQEKDIECNVAQKVVKYGDS